MVARDIVLAELTGAHVHIAHISTAGAVRMVRDARARGVRVTARGDAASPPADRRGRAELGSQHARWRRRCAASATSRPCLEALADGTIDCIATDHAPHALSEKEDEFAEAANGIVGLETAVSAAARPPGETGRHRPADAGHAAVPGPARLLNLPGGSLAPGAPADITILDLEQALDGRPGRRSGRARATRPSPAGPARARRG